MGLFDSLNNLSGLSDQVKDIVNSAKDTVIPQSLQNLADDEKRISEAIAKYEQGGVVESEVINKIGYLRTDLYDYCKHIIAGGHPDPSPIIKAHPMLAQLKGRYADLDNRLSALESQYAKCTFGYQQADGSILKPSVDWSELELQQHIDASKDRTARCWLNADKNNYVA